MTIFRPIEIESYGRPPIPLSYGAPPELKWLPVDLLVVDTRYQREISDRGRKNVLRIAAAFSWAKFAVVVVAPVQVFGKERFAIVDGQHRTTAAAICGHDRVPCMVISATAAHQAAAFAAINSVVTAMSPLQLHAARVVAGDKRALGLAAACNAAGVTICRYPVPANKMVTGQTLAVGKLYAALDKYGAPILTAALSCVAKTRDGYPGGLRQELIEALCSVLEAEPDWYANEKRMLKAAGGVEFRLLWREAVAGANGSRAEAVSSLIEKIADGFDKSFGVRAA